MEVVAAYYILNGFVSLSRIREACRCQTNRRRRLFIKPRAEQNFIGLGWVKKAPLHTVRRGQAVLVRGVARCYLGASYVVEEYT